MYAWLIHSKLFSCTMRMQISSVLNPVHGVRDAQLRQGQKPFDHAKSNVMAVKEASKFNALRKAAADDQEQLQGEGE